MTMLRWARSFGSEGGSDVRGNSLASAVSSANRRSSSACSGVACFQPVAGGVCGRLVSCECGAGVDAAPSYIRSAASVPYCSSRESERRSSSEISEVNILIDEDHKAAVDLLEAPGAVPLGMPLRDVGK